MQGLCFHLFWRIRRPVCLRFSEERLTVANLEIIDAVKFDVGCLAGLTKIEKYN